MAASDLRKPARWRPSNSRGQARGLQLGRVGDGRPWAPALEWQWPARAGSEPGFPDPRAVAQLQIRTWAGCARGRVYQPRRRPTDPPEAVRAEGRMPRWVVAWPLPQPRTRSWGGGWGAPWALGHLSHHSPFRRARQGLTSHIWPNRYIDISRSKCRAGALLRYRVNALRLIAIYRIYCPRVAFGT